MSNYTKSTNFATKDTLPAGNALKRVKGAEIDDEFNALSVAIATKANTNNTALTGVPTADTAAAATNTTQLATTAFVQSQKASPTFTGVPVAPTAASGTNTTQVATTEFVTATAPTAGRVPLMSGTGTVQGGSGWAYSWSGNECTITHNLSTTNYTFVITTAVSSGGVGTITSRGTNSIDIKTWDNSGTNAWAASFGFILIAD
tara:strand:- start:7563 stop:8171 length:609 start_codon:yes stop_codon:yes gene_type:complete